MADHNKKILVTGCCGLLGREVARQLVEQGHTVFGIDNHSRFPDYKPQGFEYIRCNLVDYVANIRNDFDYIYHMAAINGTTNFYERPNVVLVNNTLGDLQLFEWAKYNPNTKIIYASSSEVIAGTDSFPTAEETDVTIKDIHNPRWSYRIPKILAENYLMNSKLNFVIVRYFNVISEACGPGHMIGDLVKKIKLKNFEVQSPNETRSFCHVSDAVEATIVAATKINREVVNIGSDEETKISDAANILATALGHPDVEWTVLDSKKGSVLRRKPNIDKLRKYFPEYKTKTFSQIIDLIKSKL
jgi:nucleoside-diphosphate-sugar epimerase